MSTVNILKCYCAGCKKEIQPDQNLRCPDCGYSLTGELLGLVLDDVSDYILIFNDDNSIGKKKLTIGKPVGDTAKVVRVSKEFFDTLRAEIHDTTPSDSDYGSIYPEKQAGAVQSLLDQLKHHAVEYQELVGKKESFAKDCFEGLTESYRRIIHRGSSLVDNELFVSFD